MTHLPSPSGNKSETGTLVNHRTASEGCSAPEFAARGLLSDMSNVSVGDENKSKAGKPAASDLVVCRSVSLSVSTLGVLTALTDRANMQSRGVCSTPLHLTHSKLGEKSRGIAGFVNFILF